MIKINKKNITTKRHASMKLYFYVLLKHPKLFNNAAKYYQQIVIYKHKSVNN